MTQHLPTRALGTNLSRRGFLAAGGGTLAAFLAGCGGGQGVGSRPSAGGGAEFTGKYDGPPVTLDYWNGFTGGDGPTMQEMLKTFNDSQKNITVKNNTVEWADFYQRLLGWSSSAGPGGMTMLAAGGGPFAGTGQLLGEGAGWIPFVEVEDVTVATGKAVQLGAKVVREKARGPAGEFAVISDPGGAAVALWQKA